jgi:Spy/CpxP family protein refolding chaperone
MKLNKTLMIAALAVGGMFATSLAHAQDDATNTPPAKQGMRGGRGMSLDAVAKRLDLTDDQKDKVKPILEDMQKKMTDLRSDSSTSATDRRSKMKEIRDDATTKLKKILTPEQLTKWEAGTRRRPAAKPEADNPPQ